MKIFFSIQPAAKTTKKSLERDTFAGVNNEILYTVVPDRISKPIRFKEPVHSFTAINKFNKFFENIAPPLPVKERAIYHSEWTAKKTTGYETEPFSLINMFLKQVAARLSDIEFAIANYDAYRFQFATYALKGLLINIRMPMACHLALQMEELVKENKSQEVNDVLLALKKLIAQEVKHSQQLNARAFSLSPVHIIYSPINH